MKIMVPFVATGLRASQRCVWVSPPAAADAFRASLAEIGGDLPTLEASGQLFVVSDIEFYLEGGVFDPDRMMELLTTLLEDGQRQGYGAMRVAADVSGIEPSKVDRGLWYQYESQLTDRIAGLPLIHVCQYQRRQVSGDMIVTALRTHAAVIMGDTMKQNPFYVGSGRPAGTEVM
jgi:hypothetical protein